MMTNTKLLGIMKPLGGGDPIPLKKTELVLGRRPTCDVRLDFENVSGKHCQLRYIKGVWHVRDLGSTNGTTVNGQKIGTEHGLMPDDELGIAGHYFTLDYDPVAPSSLIDANMMLEEEIAEAPVRHRSLMELAGLANDDAARPSARPTSSPSRRETFSPSPPPQARPEPQPDEDELPTPAPPPLAATDDDFFDMIREDVEE